MPLPVHASWLNQIEIYFSIIQRKVLTPNDFADLAEVEQRLLDFERRYEVAAEPFEWKFTRADLAKLMDDSPTTTPSRRMTASRYVIELPRQSTKLAERGLLPVADGVYGDGVYGDGQYRVGARVTLRRNSPESGTTGGDLVDVANGQLGTVIGIDHGRLTVRLDRHPDVEVVLDDRYLARGGHGSSTGTP